MLQWLRERRSALVEAQALGASVSDVTRARSRCEGTVVIRTKYGRIHLRPKNTDLLVVRQVFVDAEYDLSRYPQQELINHRYNEIIAAGDVPVIIDAGANIGVASVWFASLFPGAAVLAVEPDPANAAIARLNAAEWPNVTVHEAAIGAVRGNADLQAFPDQGWGSRTARSDKGLPIETVEDLRSSVPYGRLFIVKVDIEGFESDLFSVNTGWLQDARAIFVEPHDWMLPGVGSSRSLQTALMGQDRELLISGENLVFI